MRDMDKTREQFISELSELRQRVAELEAVDIERKRAEKALRESEEKVRSLLENSPDIITIVDRDATIQFINHTIPELTKEEVIGKRLDDFTAPEYHDIYKKTIDQVFQTGQADSLMTSWVGPNRRTNWYETRIAPINQDGQVVAVMLISRDITERKGTEEVLRRSEEKYRDLVERVKDVIYTLDARGNITSVNSAARTWGYQPAELIGRQFLRLIPEGWQEKAVADFDKLLETGEITDELVLLDKEGEPHFVEYSSTTIKEDDKVAGARGIIRDITERKRAEEALKENEERFRNVLANSLDMIYRLNLETGTYDYVSPSSSQIIGYSPEELTALGIERARLLAHPDDIQRLDDNVIQLLTQVSEEGLPLDIEYRINHKELGYHWVSDNRSLVRDESNMPVAVVGNLRDITERKQAEDALRSSRDYLEKLTNSMWDAVFSVKMPERVIEWANDSIRLTGYEPEECIGKATEFLYPDKNEFLAFGQKLKSAIAAGKDMLHVEQLLRRKNGQAFPAEITTTFFRENDELVRVTSIVRDITERKKAEEALRDSEQKLRLIFKSIGDGVVVTDLEGTIIEVNDAALRMSGYDREELVERNGSVFLAEKDFSMVSETLRKAFKEGYSKARIVYPVLSKDSRELAAEFSTALLRDSFGKATGFIAVVRDITERRRAEEELIRLSNAVRMSTDSIVISDLEATIVEVNEATLKMFGTDDKTDLVGKNALELIAPEDREKALAGIQEVLERGYNQNVEYHIITKDGSRILVEMSSAIMKGVDSKPTGFVAVSRDITERKRMEEELRNGEEKLRRMFESIGDSVILTDLEGTIIEMNEAAVRLAGYSNKEEVIGRNGFEFIAEKDLAIAIDFMKEIVEKGCGDAADYTLVDKYKREISIEVSAALLRDSSGNPAGFVVVNKDITERKRAEEQIERHTKRVEALYTVAHVACQTLNLDEFLNEALARVLEVMDADIGVIYLFDMQAKEFTLKAQIGVSGETAASIGLVKLDEGEIRRGLEWQEPVVEPFRLFNEANMARIAAAMENERVRVHITVPFWYKDMPLGALAIADRHERQFSTEDVDLLRAIGNEIAVGIENGRLLERTREISVTDELTGLYNRRHFYERLNSEVERTQRYGRSFSLIILDLDGFKEYNDRFGHTNGDAVLQSLAQTLKSKLRKSDIVFRYGGDEFAVILPATDADRAKWIIDRIRSKWIQTPKAQYPTLESPLGFSAGIAQYPENAETTDGLVFLADTALYYAKREGGYRATLVSDLSTLPPDALSTATLDQVYALAATVDAKDPYTYGHSTRVAAIAEKIAKAIGLSGKELADLYAASLLHDIGKVGIPDVILTKPGALSKDEWRTVRKHAAEGAKILGYVRELRASVPMIRHHHEWYEGNGYPDGLKGEEIPLGARIISVADAYDTMTTPRLYRAVVSHQEACEELRQHSGTQFDPELVDALCLVMDETNEQD